MTGLGPVIHVFSCCGLQINGWPGQAKPRHDEGAQPVPGWGGPIVPGYDYNSNR